MTCFSTFCYLSAFFAYGTFKVMLHGKIGPSDVNTSIIPMLIKNYVNAKKFDGRKSEMLNVASHSILV